MKVLKSFISDLLLYDLYKMSIVIVGMYVCIYIGNGIHTQYERRRENVGLLRTEDHVSKINFIDMSWG